MDIKEFNREKKNIFLEITNFENQVISIQGGQDMEEFRKGVAPFLISIASFYKSSANAFQASQESISYFLIIKEQIRQIEQMIEAYINVPQVLRLPSIYTKECERTYLINNLQMMVQSITQTFKTLHTSSKSIHEETIKDSNSLLIEKPKQQGNTFIPSPVFKEEYKSWNITLPFCKITHKAGNGISKILRSKLLKIGVISGLVFLTWNNLNHIQGVIDEIFVVTENPQKPAPIEVLQKIQQHIRASNGEASIFNQISAIANMKMALYPNSKIQPYNKEYVLTGDYNKEQCEKFLDYYEEDLKEGFLTINEARVTERADYSNMRIKSEAHPSSFFCSSDHNKIRLVVNYEKTQESYRNNEYFTNWAKRIVAMDKFYERINTGHSGYRHLIDIQAAPAIAAFKDIKEKNPAMFNLINSKITKPNYFIGNKIESK